jgi:hypothetical protein
MTDLDVVRRQAQTAKRYNRAARRRLQKEGRYESTTASGIIVPDPEPSPEHFHVIYVIPKEGIAIPHWADVFLSRQQAREKLQEIGLSGEPNVEWYEDGRVGVEMRLRDRTDLYWVILEVAACVRGACTATVRRENLKRALFVVPGKKR